MANFLKQFWPQKSASSAFENFAESGHAAPALNVDMFRARQICASQIFFLGGGAKVTVTKEIRN